jgi:hypothetical protein
MKKGLRQSNLAKWISESEVTESGEECHIVATKLRSPFSKIQECRYTLEKV